MSHGTLVLHVGRDVTSAAAIGFATDLSCQHNVPFIDRVTAQTGDRFSAGVRKFLKSIRVFCLAASRLGQVS